MDHTMPLNQTLFAGKLRAYAQSKTKSAEPYNVQKVNFFNELTDLLDNNQLCVAVLNQLLISLSLAERQELFYRQRAGKASSDSRAAQLIASLYRDLFNTPLNEFGLKMIVAGDLTTIIKKDTLQERLERYPYEYWCSHPFSRSAKEHLEQELKIVLNVQDDHSNSSLAEALKAKGFQCNKLIKEVFKRAPEYLPTLIDELYRLYDERQKANFVAELIIYLKGQPSSDKVKAIGSANLELSSSIVREGLQFIVPLGKLQSEPPLPDFFFSLASSMQKAILSRLQKQQDWPSLVQLAEQTKTKIPSNINRPIFDKLMTDDAYRAAVARKTHPDSQAFNRLRDKISARISLLEPINSLAAKHQASTAVKLIDNYLASQPGEYKTEFYTKLRSDLLRKGLTLDLLQGHLAATDPKKLFEKWSGFENSQAAKLMVKLANLANFSTKFAIQQLDPTILQSTNNPNLVTIVDKNEQAHFLQRVTRRILVQPARARTALEQEIAKEVTLLQSYSQIELKDKEIEYQRAEAIYQRLLIEEGLKQAKENLEQVVFDPQGHLLIKVSIPASVLEQAFKAEIVEAYRDELLDLYKEKITLCNLDISQDSDFRKAFENKVLGEGTKGLEEEFEDPQGQSDTRTLESIDFYLNSPERSSVIALQEELMMHVSLHLRAIEKFFQSEEEAPPSLLSEEEHHKLILAINGLVLARFRELLINVYQKNIRYGDEMEITRTIDFVQLNKDLDLARKELAPRCRQLLAEALKPKLNEAQRQRFKEGVSKELFTSTTATGLDYLRTDSVNQTGVRIVATEHTAHDKQAGAEHQALRPLRRNFYDSKTGEVQPYSTPTIEARVPSLAVKADDAVADVAAKLSYAQGEIRKAAGGYQGPLVYNLLTSFPAIIDFGAQRASAEKILRGAHVHNAKRLLEDNQANDLVFVQNIPVNQHGDALDLRAFDNLRAEASLMAEVALLATLKQHAQVFPPLLAASIEDKYKAIHQLYLEFLPQANDQNDLYFKDSPPGKKAIEILSEMKTLWQKNRFLVAENDISALVVQALFKMLINKEHQNKQYGMLIQALSVFVEPLSLAGCKSANERYQAIAGRVELLKGLCDDEKYLLLAEQDRPDDLPPPTITPKQAVVNALRDYVQEGGSSRQLLAKIQEKLDCAYNLYNLQGSAASFSEEDQGASSKVRASESGHGALTVGEINTNIAESGYLTHLSQKYSSGMQAHKVNLAEEYGDLLSAGTVLNKEQKSSTRPLATEDHSMDADEDHSEGSTLGF